MHREIVTSCPATTASSRAATSRPSHPPPNPPRTESPGPAVASRRGRSEPAATSIPVPELRDYHQINAELVRRLDLGQRHVRLEGVAGHRLLVAGLAGPWQAIVEVDGNAGPELAAEL